MKLKNLYLLSITLLSVALTACSDDTETFDNQVYIDASVKTSNVLLKNTIPSAEGEFRVAMAKPENALYIGNSTDCDSCRICSFRKSHIEIW